MSEGIVEGVFSFYFHVLRGGGGKSNKGREIQGLKTNNDPTKRKLLLSNSQLKIYFINDVTEDMQTSIHLYDLYDYIGISFQMIGKNYLNCAFF